jgi:hypothetical protein
MSCGRFEDSSVESGTGNTEVGSDFGDRGVGCFEQCVDDLDLFGRELGRPAVR